MIETTPTATGDTNAEGAGPEGAAAPAAEGQSPAAGDTQTTETDTSATGEGEGTTEGGDTAAAEGDDAAAARGAPEQYADFNYVEGYQVDEKATEAFRELAKDTDLSQENAQKFVDFEAKRMEEAVHAQTEQWNATQDSWKQTISGDEEMGGIKYEQSMATVSKAIDTFGTPELRTFLNDSGLGNHPELVRVLYRAGNAISEDRLVSGEGGDATTRTFYKNSDMK